MQRHILQTVCRVFTRKHPIPYTSWRNCSNFWHSTSQQINLGCIIKLTVFKLFMAGKHGLVLSAGEYHMKFIIKNLGNKSSFLQEKGTAKYPGLQVSFQLCEMFQQLWLASVEGLARVLTVQIRVQAINQLQTTCFNIHETHAYWVKVFCGANRRSQQ